MDFGEAIGMIVGVRQKIHVLCMDLPQTDRYFVEAYPGETTEAFLDGSLKVFGVSLSILISIVVAFALLPSLAGMAAAQGSRCVVTPRTDPPPPRQVLTCGNGLTIIAEQHTVLKLADGKQDGRLNAVELDAKAILVDRPPGGGSFQVLTPHAVASVRGTVWAVDVSPEQTSVFVQRGRVAVRRPGGRPVTLAAGNGVDVKPGTAPLTVTRWGAARVAALLARFGR